LIERKKLTFLQQYIVQKLILEERIGNTALIKSVFVLLALVLCVMPLAIIGCTMDKTRVHSTNEDDTPPIKLISGMNKYFEDCNVSGSTTILDYQENKLYVTDTSDMTRESLPASTFKIINMLIALEIQAIDDENDIVEWHGNIDTLKYGYRPKIYRDMTIKEAFQESAGWVFVELAKKIGR